MTPTTSTASVILYDLPKSPYRLAKPLHVDVETDQAGFVVSEPQTGVFAYHRELGPALDAFLKLFLDNFEFLQQNEQRLAPGLGEELKVFRRILIPRDAHADTRL